MEIGVIGGGAIGLLFAAYLSKKHDVTVYTRTKEQAEILRQKGILVEGKERFQGNVFDAINSTEYREKVLIISVKQYHLENLISSLQALPTRTIIFVQNGMAHIELVKKLPMHHVYFGVVEHGVMKIDNHSIYHSGIGRTIISGYNIRDLCNVKSIDINHPSFPIEYDDHWYNILAKKLLANAIINPLTALFKIPNGELMTNPYFYHLAETLFQEVWEVLNLENRKEHWDYVKSICKKTAKNKSSMLKDLMEGRKTEIDAILGYVLTEAAKKKLFVPTVEFLYHSIKGMERQWEDRE